MFIRFLGNIINTDQIVLARFFSEGPKRRVHLLMTTGDKFWADGNDAVELMGFLCVCCEKNLGPDLSLYKIEEDQTNKAPSGLETDEQATTPQRKNRADRARSTATAL